MELFRALVVLCERPAKEHRAAARALGLSGAPNAADWSELFLFQLYPYASVYLGEQGMLGGEARDRVAGFWRALGVPPPAEPDHLAALLALYAELAEREGPGHARRALLWEHLLSWLPPYLDKVAELGGSFYGSWAELLRRALEEEAERLPADGLLPLQLRVAPDLADPREHGAEVFMASLFAPARAGFLVVRADLAAAARALELGLRVGERRYVLRALLEQDPARVLAWLARDADAASEVNRRRNVALAPVSDFWAARAAKAAALLTELAAAADDDGPAGPSGTSMPLTGRAKKPAAATTSGSAST
jgi:TorA maturation chaperone TorD